MHFEFRPERAGLMQRGNANRTPTWTPGPHVGPFFVSPYLSVCIRILACSASYTRRSFKAPSRSALPRSAGICTAHTGGSTSSGGRSRGRCTCCVSARARVRVTFLPEPEATHAGERETARQRAFARMRAGLDFGGEQFDRAEIYEQRIRELESRQDRSR